MKAISSVLLGGALFFAESDADGAYRVGAYKKSVEWQGDFSLLLSFTYSVQGKICLRYTFEHSSLFVVKDMT